MSICEIIDAIYIIYSYISFSGKGKERKYQALVDEKSLWVNASKIFTKL